MRKIPKKRKGYQHGTERDGVQREQGSMYGGDNGAATATDRFGNPITSGKNNLEVSGTEFKTTGDYTNNTGKTDFGNGTSYENAAAKNDMSSGTTNGATKGASKGASKGAGGNSMAWLQYANMAQQAVRKGNEKNLERVTDPETGKEYTKYKDDKAIYTESFAQPTHEKVLNKAEEGDWKGVAGQVFGGHFYDLYDKNKKQKEFYRVKNNQLAQDAVQARESGQTMTNTGGVTPPSDNEKWNEKAGNYIFGKLGAYAKGGEITGKGTGTSDSINAELKENSFIVPAKNADLAKDIREKFLGDNPNKKAKLHHGKSAVPVKVSNGEHVFSPEEKDELEEELGEDFLKSLAPEAEENEEGMANGGELSSEKAKTMLKDNQANGKPLTDKQKRYFGWIAGGRKMATGGDVTDETTPNKINSKNPPTKKGAELEKLKQDNNFELGTKKTYHKKATKANPFQIDYIKTNPVTSLPQTEVKDATADIVDTRSNAIDTNPVTTQKQNVPTQSFWDRANQSGGINNAMTYGLGALQIGMGLKGLKDKRPINTIDPAFNTQVNQAISRQQQGFNPFQNLAIDQANQNALNQELFAARNFAGGSNGNAYNMTRSALNNAFNRSLQKNIADADIQAQNRSIADNLTAQRANMSTNIFNNSLRAFEQKQASASDALNAGISNIFSANRFSNYMNLRDQENQFNQTAGI